MLGANQSVEVLGFSIEIATLMAISSTIMKTTQTLTLLTYNCACCRVRQVTERLDSSVVASSPTGRMMLTRLLVSQ